MRCVFLLCIVAFCVMYMHAPALQAKEPLFRRLQKRSGDNSVERSGERFEEEAAEGEKEEEIGELRANIDKARQEAESKSEEEEEQKSEEQKTEEEEENGELNAGIDKTVRRKRAGNDKAYLLWPSTSICYKFKSKADETKTKTVTDENGNKVTYNLKQFMANAADTWNKAAGLHIYYDENGKDCILVTTDEDGCWSWIGYQKNGKNQINLHYPGCLSHGVILHEFGHAFGLCHEAKRNDRDNSISVKGKNIQADAKGEFTKDEKCQGINSDAYPRMKDYDFCSIMHYSSKAFSATGKATIVMKSKSGEAAEDVTPCMGSNIGLSLRDGEAIATLYDTLATDQASIDKCKYGGYVLTENKNKCVCSNLFSGESCGTPKHNPANAQCGETTIELKTEAGGKIPEKTFKTPNFGAGQYPVSTSCTWVATSPKGTRVVIKFPKGYDLEVEASDGTCAFDWFGVIWDELLTLKTKRYCGKPKSSTPLQVVAESNKAAVVFHSDSMYAANGFEAKFTYEGTPTIDTSSQVSTNVNTNDGSDTATNVKPQEPEEPTNVDDGFDFTYVTEGV